MIFVEIYNSDGKIEMVRADLIESIIFPDPHRVNDYGAVMLVGGRRIDLGPSNGQAHRLNRMMSEL